MTYKAGRSIDSITGSLDTVALMGVNLRVLYSACYCGVILCSIVVSGCGPAPVAVKPVAPPPAPTATADAAIRNGDFLGAATEFERLAHAGGPQAGRHRMMAALSYFDAGDIDASRALLVDPGANDAVAGQLYTLARVATGMNDVDVVANQTTLQSIARHSLSPYPRNFYDRTAGRLALSQGDYVGAAGAFIAADSYPLPAEHRHRLHQNTWRSLARLDPTELSAILQTGSADQVAWLALARASRTNIHDSEAHAAALESWLAQYPQHPANISIVGHLRELSQNLLAPIQHIGLLLPLEGPYANAATAIRDGFLSAWYAEPALGPKPRVSILSVDAERVNASYDEAVAAGADLIVGPLEKSAVEALLKRPDLPVRTLALNVADFANPELNKANFFQFGLTPEDEAIDAAEKAWGDGHTQIVAIGPQSPWGTRVLDAFTKQFESLGGTLLSQVTYGGEGATYAGSIKRALNIDLSEARAAELRRALNRAIVYEPRRRRDVEAIFLAGFPVSARQLLPQLRYFRAASIPIYSTSHAYAGAINPGADQDLDGLRFGDMPWILGLSDRESYQLFYRYWPQASAGTGRLFAFGMDIYRIADRLAQMRYAPDFRISGATGDLRMNANGRVIRDLAWARFASGRPRLN